MTKKEKIQLCKRAIESANIELSYQEIAEECGASPSHTHRTLSEMEHTSNIKVKKPNKNRILDILGL